MAEPHSNPKGAVRNTPGRSSETPQRPEVASGRACLQPAWNTGSRGDDRAFALESDLSADMVVSDHELDAVCRLLGDELDHVLQSSERS
jgi:hypothetical protein